jgi:hypothetical protein
MVGVGNEDRMRELALGFGFLRGKNVPHFGLAAHDFAGSSLFEALCSAPMRFEFRHGSSWLKTAFGQRFSVYRVGVRAASGRSNPEVTGCRLQVAECLAFPGRIWAEKWHFSFFGLGVGVDSLSI